MGQEIENFNGGEAQEEMRSRGTVVGVQEIDLSTEQPSQYFRLLTDSLNSMHFNPVPKNVEELINEFRAPGLHSLTGKNLLEEPVGYCKIRDPLPGRQDTWIEGLVIENVFQNRQSDKEPHSGSQFLDKIAELAFTTLTHDGRARTKLDAGVITDIANWTRARGVFRRYGFRPIGTFAEQVEVMERGGTVLKDVEVLELSRRDWEARRLLKN